VNGAWAETIWNVFRLFDCLGAIAAGILFWRKTKRRIIAGELDERDVQLRIGLLGYLAGTGVLFGRAFALGSPGGPHLAFIAIPLIWTLRPLIASEWAHFRTNRKGP
jgi:hypothetical protein